MKAWMRITGLGLTLAGGAMAWSGHETIEGGIRLFIEELPAVADPTQPVDVRIAISNGTDRALSGTLELADFVDDWNAVGPARVSVSVPPAGESTTGFRMASGPFVFDALYPVHAYLRLPDAPPLHAVRIFEVKRPKTATDDAPVVLAAEPNAQLPLWIDRAHRFGWARHDGGASGGMGTGWTGSDAQSAASISIGAVAAPDRRHAVSLHPPYRGGTGSCWAEWTIDLPDTLPIVLSFATAIHHSGETDKGRSDGVLYRVRVAQAAAPAQWTVAHEEFHDAREWKSDRVDLSAYAGGRILLRLESDPGPKRNTTFDSSHWAWPVIASGVGAIAMQPAAPAAAGDSAASGRAAAVASGRVEPDGRTAFRLASPSGPRAAASVEPGFTGLLDGVLALAVDGLEPVRIHGIEIDVDDTPVGRFPSPFAFRGIETRPVDGGLRYVHTFSRQGQTFDIALTVKADGPALRISAESSRRITRFRIGPWNRPVSRVFWGHGYCITDPEPFVMTFGGHRLSSSHAAAEFVGGPAVLQAVDLPPDHFEVDRDHRIAALQTRHNATLTLLPGRAAMDCAIAYRPLDPRQAAGGVQNLAGRFCFDIWGGRYAEIADHMERMIRYGLTDAFLTIHNWQRWGYDYQLPDIWPPNPALGSLEDMKRIGDICRAQGIPWGLHDNYIDFYPDAGEYSYRKIYFSSEGRPALAWLNEGRGARAYKWRADAILPYVERNTKLIRDGVGASHSFVDVFASQGCIDTWTHDGQLIPSHEMRRHWGEAFARIREILGDNAPTTSESGHDQLIGWLDGSDCQWLRITDRSGMPFSIRLACREWTRVPWMAAVHHHRYSLHGAGYSSRFEGGLGRLGHGINSDEYLASEMLGGHALMTDSRSWGRAAVRKYWLMQDAIRSLALRSIRAHAFDGSRIDRQRVEWDNGAVVEVNQGPDDWEVGGAILPPNGWRAVAPNVTATVARIEGRIVESATAPGALFCRARTSPLEPVPPRLNIRPRVETATADGKGLMNYRLAWDVKASLRRDYRVFVHFVKEEGENGFGPIAWQDDFVPDPATTAWKGSISFDRKTRIPDGLAGRYRILTGLFDHRNRIAVQGVDDGANASWLGTVDIRRAADGSVAAVEFSPPVSIETDAPRDNPVGWIADFGWARTDGAFRVDTSQRAVRVIPLPDEPACEIHLDARVLLPAGARIVAVVAEASDASKPTTRVDHTSDGGWLRFRHDGQTFGYTIEIE